MGYGSYCTQIDPSGSGGMRCGPACCASVLLDAGWQSDPWELTLQLDAQIDPAKDGTTSDDLIALMAGYGFEGRKWTYRWELEEALDNGEAVLILLDNKVIVPRAYPNDASWNALHWIRAVVYSDRDDMVYCYDPLCYLVQKDGTVFQGPTASTWESISDAVNATGWPESGVAFRWPQGGNLNAR